MDLSMYELDELFLAAMKAEIEARKVYADLASRVSNAFLRDRLLFLSDEEDKHRAFIQKVWERNFPGRKAELPDKTPVPLPEVTMDRETPVSEVLQQAMDAEEAAADFYVSMGSLMDDEKVKNAFEYLAAMETGHYRLLELEKEQMDQMEGFDQGWEMMHLGP